MTSKTIKIVFSIALIPLLISCAPATSVAQDSGPKSMAIYASKRAPISFEQIRKLAPDADVKVLSGKESDWEQVEIKWPEVTLKLSRSSIASDETLKEHLAGFSGYVYRQLADGKMDAHVFSIMRQIAQTNHLYSIEADPDINSDRVGDFIKPIADSERALVFINAEVFDPEFRVLIGPDNFRGENAELPKFDSSIERKQRSMKLLADRELKPFKDLPWIVADEQVRLRNAKEVARRAICLFAVAAHAEVDGDFDANEFLSKHKLMGSLSPNEIAFLEKKDRTEQENSTMTWRYEAVWSLLWSLNQFEEIGFPDSQSDASKSVKLIIDNPQALIDNAKLRPTKEILDSADLLYRCKWLCDEARQNGENLKGLSSSVVYERLYALNWLIHHGNDDWDDVKTDS